MSPTPTPTSTMSKKAAIAGIAISAIAANDSWETQAFITGVALVSIIVQAILDGRKQPPIQPLINPSKES